MSAEHSNQPGLSVGVLLDVTTVPRWVHKILSDLRDCEFVELVVIVSRGPVGAEGNPLARIGRAIVGTPYFVYEKLDRALFRSKYDALESVDASDLLAGVRALHATPLMADAGRTLSEEDVTRIRAEGLDVVLALGVGPWTGLIAGTARCGVWSLRHGDGSGGPSLFREVLQQEPVCRTALEVMTGTTENRRVICQSYGATDLSSLYRTRNATYWKAAEFVMRGLRDLRERRADGPSSVGSDRPESVRGRQGRWTPGPWTMACFLARLAWRYLHNRYITHLRRIKWFVAIRPRREMTKDGLDTAGFEAIAPPKGRFWADPFLLDVGEDTHLFFEDVDYATGKGVISHLAITADGKRTPPQVVLERDYHLSYPFVFEWDGQVYMIPETAQHRTIELYRAVEFPARWELVATLFDGVHAVDATLLEHGGRLWLFTNVAPPGGSSDDELFAFCADSPFGPWVPHPMNPIVSDVRRARPAGRPFMHDGELVRPSQDCSSRYGGAIVLNRVEVLSETDYREVTVGRIDPDWHPRCVGTHTINRSNRYEVIDGHTLPWRWHA